MPGRNDNLIARAFASLPDGVSSAARRTSEPLIFAGAQGIWVETVDGRRFIDAHAAFGAILLGHRDAKHEALQAAALRGQSLIGLGTSQIEIELAERIIAAVPCAELVAFCGSGSEATYHALRLARAATGRPLIIKFQGAYHGWHDAVAMNVASPPELLGRADVFSAGSLRGTTELTRVLPFNDEVALEALIAAEPESVAAVIIEPVLHNTVAIRATDSFLRSLRTLTAKQGIVLIFDEVITGFRHHLGGYQAICGVTPDLSTFGKALGNGFPIAGLCGERTLMARFGSACKPQVNLGGTFNAAPAGVAAAIATMTLMGSAERYARLFELGERLTAGLRKAIAATQIPAQVISYGSIVGVHFTGATSIHCYEDVASSDRALDEAFRRGLLARGILVSTQPFRRFHLTLAHDEASIDRIVDAARATLAAMGDRSTER